MPESYLPAYPLRLFHNLSHTAVSPTTPGTHLSKGRLMQVVVARIGKAHGLRGEVTVQVLTGAADERFVPGASFVTEPPEAGPLVLRSARDNNGILLLGFENTCLLYTSPSPRDGLLSRMPSS